MQVTTAWRRSSHSSHPEGNCVELAQAWRKSSHSTPDEGECIEVGAGSHLIAVRDSKDPTGPVLALAPATWRALLTDIKADATI
ncbi:DUF397 domain-containing protein [Actinomadura macrotermitis]|uniref:DUF397 domain-containing protein n=1 Tax=Actinomadura macrotermitis TaxID=2585200 RepID=A0A7K0BX69_9ACTN|nr:DUF397 domain-containing protein [Actinomadura macrotermitis]MQY05783.1 hypothetical protein [Actinomadura macrotermitis]